ncbi:putative Ufm1-specific protease [Platanthera zijinensis]|uniref:Probable Ufm1-specific protease n=1 Tax=Platanthera zijinensis TaxID=2320716 RepID=A0AAP0G051_9ASPA
MGTCYEQVVLDRPIVRILCGYLEKKMHGHAWLTLSPFNDSSNILSALKTLAAIRTRLDFSLISEDLEGMLPRGEYRIGGQRVGETDSVFLAMEGLEAAQRLARGLCFNCDEHQDIILAISDLFCKWSHFRFSLTKDTCRPRRVETTQTTRLVMFLPECHRCLVLLWFALHLVLVFILSRDNCRFHEILVSLIDQPFTELKDPHVAFLVQGPSVTSDGVSSAIVLHDIDLDSSTCLPANVSLLNNKKDSDANYLVCSQFCSKNKPVSFLAAGENADVLRITVLSNQSRNISKFGVPMAEYFPVAEPARCVLASFKLDVLCFSSKDFPVASAISKLVVPGLIDQLTALKKAISPKNLSHHPQLQAQLLALKGKLSEIFRLQAYHFLPPGILHPITAVYELTYGEREVEQSEKRRSLHSRLGLPLDRPLLLIANALTCGRKSNNFLRNGYPYLKNVHTQIPSSGVSGGVISLVDGSYEYYHYLLDGIDDNGWGCAYRSLQTIMSWFGLQHYTSVEVPSHREIQQALVEIGDKEPSFVGSHEWIGAVELSFVLDKLLGVSCKIMNVRSGAELPEKCRELAAHFESQGTPVMIGGGVLAYTLLGVDYNEASGDCAFLILDPHYTGNDDLKKIVSGGWCGWKSAVDSKGRSFFLKDKFYNLLLPQRPNMV